MKTALVVLILALVFGLFSVQTVGAVTTKFIRDDATGGNCTLIGDWNAATKTCILTTNLTETIQIDSNNITLDGNGKTLTGANTGNGVFISGKTGVTIKNLTVKQFSYGIYLYGGSGNTLTNNTASSNSNYGIYLNSSSANTLTGNTASSNYYGIVLSSSSGNTLTGNTATSNSSVGIYLSSSSANTLTGNTASSNSSLGIYVYYSSTNTLSGNTAISNSSIGIALSSSGGSALSGNIMSNHKRNFSVSGSSDADYNNTIDTTNKMDNRPIYYIKNAVTQTYDATTNAGTFYCINCTNVTITGLTPTNSDFGIFLWKTQNSRIENVNASSNSYGVFLNQSSNNTLTGNTTSSNTYYGIYVQGGSSNNQIYNNSFVSNPTQAYVTLSSGNTFSKPAPVGGNYWSNYDTPLEGCNNLNGDSFCDAAYNFSGGVDNLPWTTNQNGGLDTTPPTTTDNSPSAWQKADFSVTLTCTDNPGGSGCKETKYRIDGGAWQTGASVAISTDGDHLVEYYSTDNAGNQEANKSAHAKLDKTLPTISASAKNSDNTTYTSGSWTKQDVTVHYTCADTGGSGLASCTSDQTFSATTASTSGTATDNTGNSANASFGPINIDKTAPTITTSAKKADNSAYTAGVWTNQDVIVHYTCADTGGSGLASCTPDQTFNTTTASASGTATDNAGNSAYASFGPINIDKTKPTISASATANGNPYTSGTWTNQPVIVKFTCTDTGGSGLVGSCPADQVFSAEGTFTSNAATVSDNAGNTSDPANTFSVKIDKTAPNPPKATTSPAPNPAGWNNSAPVIVSFAANGDAGVVQSGVAGCTGPTTLTAETASTKVSGTCTDNAGNISSFFDVFVEIDITPPVTTATLTPAANANGWNNTNVSVALSCTDNLSGCAETKYNLDNAGWTAYIVPISISAEGIHTLLFRSVDKADNLEAAKSGPIRIDNTPAEAYNQFDPATKDVLVFARDSGSGVPSGPTAPSSVVAIKWGDGENDKDKDNKDDKDKTDRDKQDEKDKDEKAELRTYRITDAAGNTLVLVEKVKKAGHEIKVKVMSLQYNNGSVIIPPQNRKSFEWDTEKDGALKELEQEMEVGKGKNRQDVAAKYDAKKNQTTIRIDETKPETKIVQAGLVLLRMATDKGKLVIEY